MAYTFNDLKRSDHPFFRSYVQSSSGALTLDMMIDALNRLVPREYAPIVLTTSLPVLEGAGRGIGWPDLDAHFEELARGAAHTIFGNIALNVRQSVTAAAAGRYVLGGQWPFRVAEWSKSQTIWD